jgi:hypothetical protein
MGRTKMKNLNEMLATEVMGVEMLKDVKND